MAAGKKKTLEEIRENILREKGIPLGEEDQTHPPTKVQKLIQERMKQKDTPFGKVYNHVKTMYHTRPMRKGEILAQWVRNKRTQKKDIFVWLGVVEGTTINKIGQCTIYYRPFVSQHEKVAFREDQLYTKQMYEVRDSEVEKK